MTVPLQWSSPAGPRRGARGAPGKDSAGSTRETLSDAALIAALFVGLALLTRFVPAGRPFLGFMLSPLVLVLALRSYHLGLSFFLLILPFLDLYPKTILGLPGMNPRNLMIAALLVVMVTTGAKRWERSVSRDSKRVFAAVIAVIVWCLASIAVGGLRHGVPFAISFDLWWRIAAVTAPFFLGVAVSRQGPRQRAFAVGALLIAVFGVTAWALATHSIKVSGGADPLRLRSSGVMGQSNNFGAFLALALPGFLVLALRGRRLSLRLFGALGWVVCMTGLVNTISRGSMFAAGIGFVVFGLLGHRAVLAGGLVLGVILGTFLLPSFVVERFSEVDDLVEAKDERSGVTLRIEMYQITPTIFARAPVFGHGLGAFKKVAFQVGGWRMARSPHSMYIQTLTELGLVGFLLFGLFQLTVVRALWRRRALEGDRLRGPMAIALLASTATLTIICFFQKPFLDNELILPSYLVALGIVIGMSAGPTAADAARHRRQGRPAGTARAVPGRRGARDG